MAQLIDVPGLGRLSFPDDMSDSDMAAAIKRNLPQPPQPSPAEVLAKQTGPGEAFLVGAGKKTNDILNGIMQLYLGAKGDTKALGGLESNVAEQNAAYPALAKERPWTTGLGSALPAMAIPGAGTSLGGAMLAGALPDLLSYGSAQERGTKGAVGAAGGAVGYGIGSLWSRFLKPAGVGVNPNAEAMAAADRLGYKPLAGQSTQNPMLLNVENYLTRNPGSSGTMMTLDRANKQAIDTAAAKAIGQEATDVTAPVLAKAQEVIGGEFTRLQGITNPVLRSEFLKSLSTIESQNLSKGAFADPAVTKLIDNGLELASQGNLSGAAYKEIRTELSSQATKAFKGGDAAQGQAFKAVRSALDTAAGNSLPAEEQAAWKLAREQWSNFKVLTKGLVAEGGDVSPARVAAALRQQGPQFRTGALQGPMADIGRVGEGIKGALNPNSGNLLQAGLWEPVTVPANFVAAKVYTNPLIQSYLRNGLLDLGQGGEAALTASGLPLGIAGTRGLLGTN